MIINSLIFDFYFYWSNKQNTSNLVGLNLVSEMSNSIVWTFFLLTVTNYLVTIGKEKNKGKIVRVNWELA